MTGRRRAALAVAWAGWLAACGGPQASPAAAPSPAPSSARAEAAAEGARAPLRLAVKVLRRLPHDRAAYTQGLLWHRGALFESTGQYGASTVRRVALPEATVELETELPDELFGEGLARVGERLVQLTWRAGEARVYALDSLELVERLGYRGEGWGLAYDGIRLVRSDGSDRLVHHDPVTLEEIGELRVRRNGRPQTRLNELEFAEGYLYANVYQSDEIVRIDPVDGTVRAVIDASGLLSAAERAGAEVLNGIAYDPEAATFYLTGKYWPALFEVVFVPAPGAG